MFKSDAGLFLEANNNLGIAKSYIYECKRIMSELGEISGNNDSSVLKTSIENCDIDTLVSKVDTTRNNLLIIDQNFATEYMSLLESQLSNETLDVSSMSAEEYQEYSMYDREYHQTLLFILEQYEEQGRLTDEMKEVLDFERLMSKSYGIQDKMALVSQSSDEYLSLYEQYGSVYRQMIQANPELTDAKKAELLSSYDTEYNTRHGEIQTAVTQRQEREADYKELQSLIQQKDDNDDFWHPFVEGELRDAIIEKKKKLGIATDSEIEYSNMSGGEKFWEGTKTFAASAFTGLYGLTENVVDGGAMIVGEIGGIWSSDFKSQVSDFIQTDYAGGLYTGITNQWDINSVSAYSGAHTYGDVFGKTVGRVALSFAAPWANAAVSGLAAMGESGEYNLTNGMNYDRAFSISLLEGVKGAAEGYADSVLNNNIRYFVKSGGAKDALSSLKNVFVKGKPKLTMSETFSLLKSSAGSAVKQTFVTTVTDPLFLIPVGCNFAETVLPAAYDFSSGKISADDFGQAIFNGTGNFLSETGKEFAKRFAINAFTNFTASKSAQVQAKKFVANAQEGDFQASGYQPKHGVKTNAIVDSYTSDGKSLFDDATEYWDDVLKKKYRYDLSSPEGIAASESITDTYTSTLYDGVDESVRDSILGKDDMLEHADSLEIQDCTVASDGSAKVTYRYAYGDITTESLTTTFTPTQVRSMLVTSNYAATRAVSSAFKDIPKVDVGDLDALDK